jgi:dienelactone hydrolase
MSKLKIIGINCFMFLIVATASPALCVTASLSDITGNWYSINPALQNWQDAKEAAEAAGGYLVSITSGEENKWISDTFGVHYNGDYYWLGGHDISAEGTWEWTNGEPWGYANWLSGEPNNASGVEDALTWYHEGSSNADGYEWNDRDPSQLRASLIEYDTEYIYYSATDHWYAINPIRMSWQDAKEAAEAAGGYLVSITSGEENKWISDTFGIHYNGDYYWLGGNDIAAEGTWEWANGEPWWYANWLSGEPNNASGVEDALTWYHEWSFNADGYEWNDRDPLQLRASLVEFNYNPLHVLLDAWIDNRWSGDTPQALIQAIIATGLEIKDVEALLLKGRAGYPDAPQLIGQVTTGIPIDAQHVDHSSEYLIYVPSNYDKTAQTPLIVVGHGGNDCQDLADSEVAAHSGMNPWVSFAEQHGFLMVAPLTDRAWGHIGYSIIFSTLSQVQRDYNIDPNRIYITGHSMGGHLSYRSGIYLGDRWAAISPMSGGYDYVASGLVENLFNVPGFATWGEFDWYGIDDHNRKIRDWMKDHGFFWENWEKPGGGHSIFSDYIDDVGNLFIANTRDLYRQTVFASAGPWGAPGGLSIPTLKFETADQRSCWGITHTWDTERPIPASTFHWLRLSPSENENIVQRVWAANKGNNTFEITSENARQLRLYLHPTMVDFSSPVVVEVNGETLYNGIVEPDLATMLYLVREFDDRGRVFYAAIDIAIDTDLPPHEPSYYDVNNDGCVDRADLNIILTDIRSPAPHDPLHDLNRDGVVNIADARYLVTLFTNPRGAPCQ